MNQDHQISAAQEADLRAMEFMYQPTRAVQTTEQIVRERHANKIELTFPWAGAKGIVDPFVPKTYSVLQARTSEGKTTFATAIAIEWALQAQKQDPDAVVVYATWEPRVEELVSSVMLPQTGVSVSRMLSGRTDWNDVRDKMQGFAKLPLFIFSNSAIRNAKKHGSIMNIASIQPSMADLDRALDIWSRDYNVVAVIIDYLQIAADATFPRERNRLQRVMDTSDTFRLLAEKHDCAVLALAQSRVESATYSFEYTQALPTIHDIQWASKTGQDADRVFAITLPIKNTLEQAMTVDLGIRPGAAKRFRFEYDVAPNRYVLALQKQRHAFPNGKWVLDIDPMTLQIQEVSGMQTGTSGSGTMF